MWKWSFQASFNDNRRIGSPRGIWQLMTFRIPWRPFDPVPRNQHRSYNSREQQNADHLDAGDVIDK